MKSNEQTTNEIAKSDYQLGFIRACALREARKWINTPGARASDVVAAAVWFEDYLLHGENYTRSEERTGVEDVALGEDGMP